MAEFAGDGNYFAVVYGKGAAALLAARAAAGPGRRSTPRSAATSTRTRGRSRPRPTSAPRSPTCPPRSAPRRRPGPGQGRPPPASAPSLAARARAEPRDGALVRRGQQPLHARDALDEVVVAQGVGHPHVAGRPEGLAGDDGDLGLLQDQLGQLRAGLRRRGRRSGGRAGPSPTGRRRTRPAAPGRRSRGSRGASTRSSAGAGRRPRASSPPPTGRR